MVAEHHDGPVRDARRERLRQLLRASPRRDSERLVAGKRWARPAAVLSHRYPRRPAAARR